MPTRGTFDRLQRWAHEIFMKFNPKHKYKLSREWIESSPKEKHLGTVVDEKPQQEPAVHAYRPEG